MDRRIWVPARMRARVDSVARQAPAYAEAWERHNEAVIQAGGLTWVALGDSLSQGIGAATWDGGWVLRALALMEAAGRPQRVLNLSRSGATTIDVVNRQLELLRQQGRPPEVVTALVGTNDLLKRVPRARTVANWRTILDALVPGSVVALMPQPVATAREVNRHVRDAEAASGVRTINLRRVLPPLRHRAADLFHPDDRGHARLAEAFAAAMLNARPHER